MTFVVALIVFGPKKLPELGKGLGEGLRGFKEGMKGMQQFFNDPSQIDSIRSNPADPSYIRSISGPT